MPYFILGVAVLIGLFLMIRGLRRSNPQNLQKTITFLVLLVAAGVIAFLAAMGRLGPIGWAALLLPLLFRWRQFMQTMKNLGGPSAGRNSDVQTRYLRMTLEHDSGVLSGTVLAGPHKGRNLDEMPVGDLLDLLREDLALTGTHVGCDTAQCGACTVLKKNHPDRGGSTWVAAQINLAKDMLLRG